MRNRIDDNRVDVTINRVLNASYTWKCNDQEATVTHEKYSGNFQSTDDVVIPNFHKRRANGELFFNPFYTIRNEVTLDSPGWNYTRSYNGYNCYKDIGDGPLWLFLGKFGGHWPTSVSISSLSAIASTQALANVKKPEAQALVSLGELRETLRFLRNPLRDLTKILRKYRRQVNEQYRREQRGLRLAATTGVTVKDAIDSIGGSWLSWRYGLRPLIGEIQGVMKAIEALEDKRARFTARGYAADEAETIQDGSSGTFSLWDYSLTHQTYEKVECRAGVLYDVSIADAFGTDLSQIPVALWELTFLSFMVDWMVNIGDYIAAITPRGGIQKRGEWLVVHRTRDSTTTFDATFNPVIGATENVNPSGTEHWRTVTVKRVPHLRASLAFRPEFINFDLGTARYVDMLLIARNLITG